MVYADFVFLLATVVSLVYILSFWWSDAMKVHTPKNCKKQNSMWALEADNLLKAVLSKHMLSILSDPCRPTLNAQ